MIIDIYMEKINLLIIGFGEVAKKKCRKFIEEGASTTIIDSAIDVLPEEFSDARLIKMNADSVEMLEEFIEGAHLIILGTGDEELNEKIASFCHSHLKMVLDLSNSDNSSFANTSILKYDNIEIGVSTNGISPIISSRIKGRIEDDMGEYLIENDKRLAILKDIRNFFKKRVEDKEKRRSYIIEASNMTLEELGALSSDPEEFLKEEN